MFKVISVGVRAMGEDMPVREINAPAQEQIATFLEKIGFSGAMCVGKNGKIVSEFYTSDFNEKTQFKIASLTKQFTAMAIMQLVEDKKIKLNLDDTLKTFDFFKGFPHGDIITVRHLLGMTSGLPRHINELNKTDGISIEGLVDHIKNQIGKEELLFPPGTKFQYSNINYQILTYIIEKTSGIEYATYMEDNIFKPLGMTQTRVEPLKNPGKNTHMSLSLGAGSVFSSVDDMWIWQQHLEELGRGVPGRISPQSFAAMTTSGQGKYGFGLFVESNSYYHGGLTPDGMTLGGRSYFRHQEGTTIIVFSKNVREEVEFIAEVVEFKMKGESMPPDLQHELELMKIRFLIRKDQISEAIQIFSEVQRSMEGNEAKAEFLGRVGTFYYNSYVKDRNGQDIDQGELDKMIKALEDSLILISKLPKPPEYTKEIEAALKGLIEMRSV